MPPAPRATCSEHRQSHSFRPCVGHSGRHFTRLSIQRMVGAGDCRQSGFHPRLQRQLPTGMVWPVFVIGVAISVLAIGRGLQEYRGRHLPGAVDHGLRAFLISMRDVGAQDRFLYTLSSGHPHRVLGMLSHTGICLTETLGPISDNANGVAGWRRILSEKARHFGRPGCGRKDDQSNHQRYCYRFGGHRGCVTIRLVLYRHRTCDAWKNA